MTNKMILILLLFCTAVVNDSCGQQVDADKKDKMQTDTIKNIYSFNDSINKRIVEGIDVLIRELALAGGNKSNLFILLDKDGTSTYLMISYCLGCPFSDLLKSTDRFYIDKEGFDIPIIFELDFKFSALLNNEKGVRLNPKVGGYSIKFNNKGEVVSQGLLQ